MAKDFNKLTPPEENTQRPLFTPPHGTDKLTLGDGLELHQLGLIDQ